MDSAGGAGSCGGADQDAAVVARSPSHRSDGATPGGDHVRGVVQLVAWCAAITVTVRRRGRAGPAAWSMTLVVVGGRLPVADRAAPWTPPTGSGGGLREIPTTSVRRLTSQSRRSSGFVDQIVRQCACGTSANAVRSAMASRSVAATAVPDRDTQDLPAAVRGHAGGDGDRLRDDPLVDPDLGARRVRAPPAARSGGRACPVGSAQSSRFVQGGLGQRRSDGCTVVRGGVLVDRRGAHGVVARARLAGRRSGRAAPR